MASWFGMLGLEAPVSFEWEQDQATGDFMLVW